MSCCCCPSVITVTVNNCSGAVVGASITITGAGGPYSGTTDSTGTFVQNIPGGDDGNFTVSYTNGGFSGSSTVNIPTGKCAKISVPFFYVDKTCVTVLGCSGGISGVSISGNGANCTTDGTGKCCLTYSSNPPASITVTATYNSRTLSTTLSGAGQCSTGFQFVTKICFCVTSECCGFVVTGAAFPYSTFVASASLTVNGHAAGSGTTDKNGYLCITPTYGTIPGDTVSVALTATGFTGSTATWTLPNTLAKACAGCSSTASFDPCLIPNQSGCVTQGVDDSSASSPFVMVHDGTHHGGFGQQSSPFQPCPCDGLLGRTCTVNDGIGNVTLTAASGCGTYSGCAIRTATNSCEFDPPNCPVTAGGSVPVFFSWTGTNLAVACPTCDTVSNTPRHDVDCTLNFNSSVRGGGINPAIYLTSCVPIAGTVTASTTPGGGVSPLFYIYGATVTLTLSP